MNIRQKSKLKLYTHILQEECMQYLYLKLFNFCAGSILSMKFALIASIVERNFTDTNITIYAGWILFLESMVSFVSGPFLGEISDMIG